jgi:hypothetical protein
LVDDKIKSNHLLPAFGVDGLFASGTKLMLEAVMEV